MAVPGEGRGRWAELSLLVRESPGELQLPQRNQHNLCFGSDTVETPDIQHSGSASVSS